MTARALPRGARRAGKGLGLGAELLVVSLALVAVGVFHVWSRTRVLSAGYELGELQKQHAELVAQHDALRIELEMVRSPAKLDEAVRTKLARLGLAPPDRGAVLAAGPGRPLDAPGRAGGDGVGDLSRPAGPALHTAPVAPGRAAAGSPSPPSVERGERAHDRVALRGPLRAGRTPTREP